MLPSRRFSGTRTWLVAICAFILIQLAGCNRTGTNPEPGSSASTAPDSSPSSEGVWKATAAIMAGAPFPDPVTASITLKIVGTTYEVTVGPTLDKGNCIIDRNSAPFRMTITGTEGPNLGRTLLAIFDFPDPNTMRVTYDLAGAAFPATFESTAKNGLYSATYSRQE